MIRLTDWIDPGESRTGHLRWWVTTTGGFFPSDGHDEGSIHMKGLNRGAPGRRQPSQKDTIPLEMLGPRITSWMIQRDLLTALGINHRLACGLAE